MSGRVVGVASALFLAVAVVVYAASRACPAVVSLHECRATIIKADFPATVEDGTVKMIEPNSEKYHFAVVTLRVEKPAGRQLVLPAADVTLHYQRGEGGYDVSPCEALSTFSTKKEEDRGLDCFQGMGPGWVKSVSGREATAADTVYVDVIFAKVERDISDAWVCIGQPATPGFSTTGW